MEEINTVNDLRMSYKMDTGISPEFSIELEGEFNIYPLAEAEFDLIKEEVEGLDCTDYEDSINGEKVALHVERLKEHLKELEDCEADLSDVRDCLTTELNATELNDVPYVVWLEEKLIAEIKLNNFL